MRKLANRLTIECSKTLLMSLLSDGVREVRVLWFWKYVITCSTSLATSNNLLHRTRSSPNPSCQSISSTAILPASFDNSTNMTFTRSGRTMKTTLHPHMDLMSVLWQCEVNCRLIFPNRHGSSSIQNLKQTTKILLITLDGRHLLQGNRRRAWTILFLHTRWILSIAN
jgi:hypothetical protein